MTTFSPWAPKSLCQYYESLLDGSEPSGDELPASAGRTGILLPPKINILGKLILYDAYTEKDREVIWSGLKRNVSRNPSIDAGTEYVETKNWYRIFAAEVSRNSQGVPIMASFTGTKKSDLINESRKHITALQSILTGIDMDMSISDLIDEEEYSYGLSSNLLITLDKISLHALLELVNTVIVYRLDASQVLSKPGDPRANIRYFVRKMRKVILDQYGKPLIPILAATTRLIFDDLNVSDEYVKSATC